MVHRKDQVPIEEAQAVQRDPVKAATGLHHPGDRHIPDPVHHLAGVLVTEEPAGPVVQGLPVIAVREEALPEALGTEVQEVHREVRVATAEVPAVHTDHPEAVEAAVADQEAVVAVDEAGIKIYSRLF